MSLYVILKDTIAVKYHGYIKHYSFIIFLKPIPLSDINLNI
jgi:hypothetical protein